MNSLTKQLLCVSVKINFKFEYKANRIMIMIKTQLLEIYIQKIKLLGKHRIRPMYMYLGA